ncbi:hypothetical protein ABZ686_30835, partial [Streptomyces sp. NPDC006992]
MDDAVACDAHWRLPADAPRMRAGLAVLPTGPEGAVPDCAGKALRELVRAGVVAVVLAPAAAPAGREAARAAGVPALVPAAPRDAEETLRHVLRRQLTVERENARSTARVLALSAAALERAEGPARLLREVA